MIIARWRVEARFGHKQEVTDSMKRWMDEIGSQIGWTANKTRLLSGSVGEQESALISEVQLEDMAELSRCWDKLASIPAHKKWSKELEPHVVSGSTRWEILRVV